MIFNVQRYSTHDGPGIRTVVFLKGCTLHCRWCQNPEGQSKRRDLFFSPETCIADCHLCHQGHPEQVVEQGDGIELKRSQLSDDTIGQLADLCPSEALTVCGEAKSVEEVRAIILRDLPYYRRSGGGITLSGGEPFAQPGYTLALLKAARALDIHTAVETCLHVPWKSLSEALPLVDLFLTDLKHVDPEKYSLWTGGNLATVLGNFAKLAASGVPMIARVPVIPDFNADPTSLMQIIDFISDCGHVGELHLLPYHTLGKNKYAMLDRPYESSSTPLRRDSALLSLAQAYAAEKGLETVIGG